MSDFWYWDKTRGISLLIAVFNLILAYFSPFPFFLGRPFGLVMLGGFSGAWFKILFLELFFALPFIWFSDIFGKWVPGETPPPFVKLGGWLLLLYPDICWLIYHFSNK